MSATALDRNTKKRGPLRQIVIPINASAVIPIGVMVAVATPSTGAVNAADTATHIVMGLSCQQASGPAGDAKIVVERGVFLMANDGTITAANVGQPCTVLDNQTVSLAATTTNDIIAGYIDEVDGEGVWVDMLTNKVGAT
jgi:predicted RecA/RadA family phage recombinase